jgi:hypothetical protein
MGDAIPTLSISTEKVCFVVVKAREFDVKDVDTTLDDGSNPTDDRMIEVLEDRPKMRCRLDPRPLGGLLASKFARGEKPTSKRGRRSVQCLADKRTTLPPQQPDSWRGYLKRQIGHLIAPLDDLIEDLCHPIHRL